MQNPQSLFPTLPRSAGPPPIVQFKAGKCVLTQQSNSKFHVVSEPKKGNIALTRGVDGLLHFKWIDRTTNAVVDDHIVMPKEAVFERVNTGVESDRVYILKWTDPATVHTVTGRRAMYWLQQKDASEDENNVKKVNEQLAKERDSQTDNVMSQLAGLLGMPNPSAVPKPALPDELRGGAAATAAPAGAASSSSSNALGSLDFADLFSQMPAAPAGSGAAGAAAPPRPMAAATATSLTSVLSSDAIRQSGVFNDPAVCQQLLQHLPESQRGDGDEGSTRAALMDTVYSPQFMQAVEALVGALNSDNFNSILSSFHIDPAPGMTRLMMGDPVGAFVECIKAEAAKKVAEEAAASSTSSGAASDSGSSNEGSGNSSGGASASQPHPPPSA